MRSLSLYIIKVVSPCLLFFSSALFDVCADCVSFNVQESKVETIEKRQELKVSHSNKILWHWKFSYQKCVFDLCSHKIVSILVRCTQRNEREKDTKRKEIGHILVIEENRNRLKKKQPTNFNHSKMSPISFHCAFSTLIYQWYSIFPPPWPTHCCAPEW